MKKKQKMEKKLFLSKKTILKLTNEQIQNVKGGIDTQVKNARSMMNDCTYVPTA